MRRSLHRWTAAESLSGPLGPDSRGAGFVEYIVVVGAVALLCFAGFRYFGHRIDAVVRGEADCLANLDCPTGVQVVDATTDATTEERAGYLTLSRSRLATPTENPTNAAVSVAEMEQAAVDDGLVVKVDTFEFPGPVNGPDDVLRYVLDSKVGAAAVQRFLNQKTDTLTLPDELAPAMAAYLTLYRDRGKFDEQEDLRDFQRYLLARNDFMKRAEVLRMSQELDLAMVRESLSRTVRTPSTSVLPVTESAPATTTSTVAVRSQQSQRQTRWIDTNGLWSGGSPGNEAFRRAAQRFGFEDAAIDIVLAEGAVTFVHFGSDTSEKRRWKAGDEVTEASLAATAEEGKYAFNAGGSILANYAMAPDKLARLYLARLAAAAGYKDIQTYFDDEANRAIRAGFWESGMLPGAEAQMQFTTWLGVQIAAGLRSPTGQLLAGGLMGPSADLLERLGVDADGAVVNGLSDATLKFTDAIGNLQRMSHMFFITKPASFVLGYNGPLPPSWREQYDAGGARKDRLIYEAKKSYAQSESTYIGQTIRVLTRQGAELPIYAAAGIAPPLLIFWEAGVYARRPIDELATGLMVDALGLMVGGLPGRMLKVTPVASALRPGGVNALANQLAKNPSGFKSWLRVQGAEFVGGFVENVGANHAEKDFVEAVEAVITKGSGATEEQKKLVVSTLLAAAVQSAVSVVLSPAHDANDRAAFQRPEAQQPKLDKNSPIFRDKVDGQERLTAVVSLSDGKKTYMVLDANAPSVKAAVAQRGRVTDVDSASVDVTLADARMRRLSSADQKKLLGSGVDKVLAEMELSKQLEQLPRETKQSVESPSQQQAANGIATEFQPVGIGKAALSTPVGQSLLRELKVANPKATPDQIRNWAHQMLDSGKTVPLERVAAGGEKLYKIVPLEGGPPSERTPYWMPEAELDTLRKNPSLLAERMGLPTESLSPTKHYQVFEIEPAAGKTPKVFESDVGPTRQGTKQSGGGKQTLVPNRGDWTTPKHIGRFP